MNEFWVNAVWSIAPTLLIGLLFWFVMRLIIRSDRAERSAFSKIEQEERARRDFNRERSITQAKVVARSNGEKP